MTAILGSLLAAALVAVAGSLAEVRRLRGVLRSERQANDWQQKLLNARGWRTDAAHESPRKPRLWGNEPPRQG